MAKIPSVTVAQLQQVQHGPDEGIPVPFRAVCDVNLEDAKAAIPVEVESEPEPTPQNPNPSAPC
jgi:hypothetical protein